MDKKLTIDQFLDALIEAADHLGRCGLVTCALCKHARTIVDRARDLKRRMTDAIN